VEVVTATEDWGVRHVIGGIVPQLQTNGTGRSLVYGVRHGHLTRTVLSNYAGYDGQALPPLDVLQRQEIQEDSHRYRGRWLVIDEFTRAPIDAAFGSLLTTLSGQRNPMLSVPTDDGDERSVPLPRDFRIIGTLNSFDRHFLNQISEAMKRRFVFIDVLPPGREYAGAEQRLAVFRALASLHEQGLSGIELDRNVGRVNWQNALIVRRTETSNGGLTQVRYEYSAGDGPVQQVCEDFWRIFEAIRVYRQLGTAQAEAVYATLFAGASIGMDWPEALDSALADVLADQLQVLGRDEQRVLLTLLEHAANAEAFTAKVQDILKSMPAARQHSHLAQFKAAGASTINDRDLTKLQPMQLEAIFDVGSPLPIDANGLFARRLSAFVSERGL
jgi:hypothetical protein